MKEILSGVHTWSAFSQEKGFDFNGYAVETSAGTVLIDPPAPADGWDALDALAPFHCVFVTNRNHSRDARGFADRYGVPVRIHERDAEAAEVRADETVTGAETVAGELTLVHVPGKSPGELAFFVPGRRALIVGDAVIGVPSGKLATYPDGKVDDRAELLRSLARLLELDFESLLLCDGTPAITGGKHKLRRFVERERAFVAPPIGAAREPGTARPPKAVRRLLRQRTRHRERSRIIRIMWVVAASIVLAAGVAMLLLPGPAFVIIPVGLAMLALEFAWAQRALELALRQAESAKDRAGKTSAGQRTFGVVAIGLAFAAFVAAAMVWDIPLLPV